MDEFRFKTVRMLAADDDEVLLELYQRLLPQSGPGDAPVEVVVCRQGDEAARAVREAVDASCPFSVAFLDIHMPPGPDGIRAAEKIRAIDPDVAIVIVTGDPQVDVAAIARRVPPVEQLFFLRKPIGVQEIQQLARALCASRAAQAELQRHRHHLEELVRQRTAELERMTEELRASEERLRSIFEFAPDALYLMDLQGTFMDGNRAAEEITGYKREELIGKSFLKLGILPPGQMPRAAALLGKNVLGLATGPDEFTLNRRQGGQVEVEISTFPVKIQGQSLVLGVARDITERKRAEAARTRLATAVEQAAEAVVITDTQGTIQYVNPAFERITGYGAEEAVGQNPRILKSGKHDEAFYRDLWDTLTRGDVWSGRFTDKRKDGLLFEAESTISPVRDESGKVINYVALTRDVTLEVLLEERLHRAQMIIESSTDAVVAIDSQGLVTEWNAAAQAMFGWTRDEMIGQPLDRLMPESYREKHREYVAGWFATGNPNAAMGRTVELPAVRKSGEEFTIELSLAGWRGARPFVTAIIRDATERKAAQQALEAANRKLQIAQREAEQASRLKSEFLANTSHEIRTPLNGILGYLQLLRAGLYADAKEHDEFVEGAIDSANHLLSLINDVLDIAKIEAGKLRLEFAEVNVAAALEHIRSLTHVQAANEGIELIVPLPEPSLCVRADPGRLNQALLNLVGNALKFTPRGGRVTVRASGVPERGYVLWEVIDTGVGIAPEAMSYIFEEFRQADGSTTREYGGTGLGLAITRQLISLMGGVLRAESEGLGKGSRFYFTLPMHRPGKALYWRREEDVQAGLQPQGPDGAPLVLVVEDDPDFSELLRLTLQKHGFRTVYAATADDGLLAAQQLKPAAITLDYGLPAREDTILRDGWDLLNALRTRADLADIPVIMVTGYENSVAERLSVGWLPPKCEWLNKPVECIEVVRTVRRMLGPQAPASPRVLVADDDAAVRRFLGKVLREHGFQVSSVADGRECLGYIASRRDKVDLLILDLMMPELDGFGVLRELRFGQLAPDLPVMVFTNYPETAEQRRAELGLDSSLLAVFSKPDVYADEQRFVDRLRSLIEAAQTAAKPEEETDESHSGG